MLPPPSQDGYVFRLQVAYHREPLILKEVVTPEGMLKYQDTEESQQLELETLHRPYLTSSLHGYVRQRGHGTDRMGPGACVEMPFDDRGW